MKQKLKLNYETSEKIDNDHGIPQDIVFMFYIGYIAKAARSCCQYIWLLILYSFIIP